MIPSTPVGPVAWVCLCLALLGCVPSTQRRVSAAIFDSSRRTYLLVITAASFTLSTAYVYGYLNGGPRIIDATSYYLQAKIFASGQFAFEPPGALHSYAGRFLVVTPESKLAVLFPPGFAALLALGVSLGVPLLVNPLVGALLSALTYTLGAQWFSERSGRLAGMLSTLCACLRYHSADTMSHAWTATLLLGLILSVTNDRHALAPWVAGVCAGWLFATRPVTGVVGGSFGLLWYAVYCPSANRFERVAKFAASALPGVALWWLYQWATTGSLWSTTQGVYYAQSDWPQDCFRLGFGPNSGCRFEHGDFIDAYQPHGFGPVQALYTTARRLAQHHKDSLNLPLGLLFAFVPWFMPSPTRRKALWLGGVVAAHMASYSLFYFDGNYPGGGARLFADILPLEHVLAGVAFAAWRSAPLAPSLALVGFALWGAEQHQALAEREGGRPMFETQVLREAGVERGLVFVSTDHGFNLGFDPGAKPDRHDHVHIARLRNDSLDHSTSGALGHPPAYTYDFDLYGSSSPQVTPLTIIPPNSVHIMGRSLWPLPSSGGASVPAHNPDGLRLLPWPGHTLELTLELSISRDSHYQLELDVIPSPSTLVVAGWPRSGERRVDNTHRVMFGPAVLQAGKTRLTLRSESEMTLLNVALVAIADAPQAPARDL